MTPLTVTACPTCDAPAEVVARFVLDSTAGPVEHARIRCVRRHWFAAPLWALAAAAQNPAQRSAPPVRQR